MVQIRHILFIGLLLVGSPKLLHAQGSVDVHPYLSDEFFFDVGVFFPDRRLKLSANGSISGIHPVVDFNQEFGLKESDEIFSVNFGWRFAKNWVLSGQYFESNGNSRWTLDEDIEWKDVVFQAGSGVAAGANFSLTRVFFGRVLDTSDPHEFGLGGGFHWLDIGVFIEGTIIIGGGGTMARTESVHTDGPLPNIGAWYKYSISPRWALTGRVDWLSADVGRYDGEMINFSFGVNYQIAEHFGIGLNYNDFELDVKIDKTDWRGRIFTSYEGLYAYMSVYW